MTTCTRHEKAIATSPICSHIAREVKERVKPEKVFTVWFCAENNEYPWWILQYCAECVKKFGFLPENQKYFGEDAEIKCPEIQGKGDFTVVCGECFDEVVGLQQF